MHRVFEGFKIKTIKKLKTKMMCIIGVHDFGEHKEPWSRCQTLKCTKCNHLAFRKAYFVYKKNGCLYLSNKKVSGQMNIDTSTKNIDYAMEKINEFSRVEFAVFCIKFQKEFERRRDLKMLDIEEC